VTPSSQDFGSVQVGNTADRSFTVQNTGGGTLSGGASVPAPFSIVSGGTYSLLAGATWTVTVRYSPTATGTHNQTVTFTGAGGANRPVSGTGVPPSTAPTITTPSPLPSGTVGTAYTQTLVASGGTAPYTWSIASGSLPSGLSLSSGGVLSGTPGAATTASFTVQVTGNDGLSSTKVFELTINPAPTPPAITTASPLPSGTVGTAYNQSLTASDGTAPYMWSISSGSLPSGLSLSSSGVISGTPSEATTANFRVQVTGADMLYSEQDFSLVIIPASGHPDPTYAWTNFVGQPAAQAMLMARAARRGFTSLTAWQWTARATCSWRTPITTRSGR